MPKGIYARKPRSLKQYPAAMVSRVRELYQDRKQTISEIAAELGVSYKVVWRLMEHHDIARRVAAKRDQRGEKNHQWKAESATYTAFHHRVESLRGKPCYCEVCGTSDERYAYDWANLTGNYPDPSDYKRMCRSCHRQYDAKQRRQK
jgi:hypothetical protein